MKLCRAPREGRELEERDLRQIAEAFHVSLPLLTRVIRQGRILQRMRGPVRAAGEGTLLAAREAEPPEEKDPS